MKSVALSDTEVDHDVIIRKSLDSVRYSYVGGKFKHSRPILLSVLGRDGVWTLKVLKDVQKMLLMYYFYYN
jgi:hypothetical protein